jgi:hypothetical protein
LLNTDEEKIGANILLNIKKLLEEINFKSTNHVMSPGKDALLLSEKVSRIFSIQKQ